MPKVNYNEISQIYDDVRQADVELINHFLQECDINNSTKILDIGCGTGNHTDLLQKVTRSAVFGIEPSEGMLSKARGKNSKVVYRRGNAENIPFENEYFDFVYMTDVIHHVPDIGKIFAEINRALKKNGKVCIVTQSHPQIEKRPIAQFFPGTAAVDKERYPDIDKIITKAKEQHLKFMKNVILHENEGIELGPDYLELVKKKGYSMLHLISDKEYGEGLKRLEAELKKGNIRSNLSGETLVWFINSRLSAATNLDHRQNWLAESDELSNHISSRRQDDSPDTEALWQTARDDLETRDDHLFFSAGDL